MKRKSVDEGHWNPRYVAYATAQGRTPDAQLAFDRLAYPGGQMAGFILWSMAVNRETKDARPRVTGPASVVGNG